MRYTAALLSVADIRASRRFYEKLFGLEVDHDYGINVSFTCGLALQQDFAWLTGVPADSVTRQSHNLELCFETEELDGFLRELDRRPEIRRLGGVIEHGWGQRVVRLYDPDGHLIEVGGGHGPGGPPLPGLRTDVGGGIRADGRLPGRFKKTAVWAMTARLPSGGRFFCMDRSICE